MRLGKAKMRRRRNNEVHRFLQNVVSDRKNVGTEQCAERTTEVIWIFQAQKGNFILAGFILPQVWVASCACNNRREADVSQPTVDMVCLQASFMDSY